MNRVEKECQKLCLGINAKKTQVQHRSTVRAETVDGTKLNEMNDFKFLGSWVDSTEDI